MPAQQGLGLDEEPSKVSAAEEAAEPGEQRPVGRLEGWAGHLTTEHGDLVAEHDNLDRQFVTITPGEREELERSDECQVEEGERHVSASSLSRSMRKSSSMVPDDIFGTHTLRPATSAKIEPPGSNHDIPLGEPNSAVRVIDESRLVGGHLLGGGESGGLSALRGHVLQALEANNSDTIVDLG